MRRGLRYAREHNRGRYVVKLSEGAADVKCELLNSESAARHPGRGVRGDYSKAYRHTLRSLHGLR